MKVKFEVEKILHNSLKRTMRILLLEPDKAPVVIGLARKEMIGFQIINTLN